MRPKKKGEYKIPFMGGDQLQYESWGEIDWLDNFEFEDTLTYHTYSRGRSAADFVFTRTMGSKVSFFMKDFSEIVPLMVNGKITGRFAFVKRGQNYGCRLVESSPPPASAA